jgi:transcription antitermination protein NusB
VSEVGGVIFVDANEAMFDDKIIAKERKIFIMAGYKGAFKYFRFIIFISVSLIILNAFYVITINYYIFYIKLVLGMSKIYKNTSSRLAGVQILYSLETSGGKDLYALENFEDHLDAQLANHKDKELLRECSIEGEKPNKKFVEKLLQAAISKLGEIDEAIEGSASNSSAIERMNMLMLSLLRCAIAELKYFDTPFKVAIKEYVKIASSFFNDSEVSFVNGVLDKISKESK